jgi:hypothetical protein
MSAAGRAIRAIAHAAQLEPRERSMIDSCWNPAALARSSSSSRRKSVLMCQPRLNRSIARDAATLVSGSSDIVADDEQAAGGTQTLTLGEEALGRRAVYERLDGVGKIRRFTLAGSAV